MHGVADASDKRVEGLFIAVHRPLDELALHASPELCSGREPRPIGEYEWTQPASVQSVKSKVSRDCRWEAHTTKAAPFAQPPSPISAIVRPALGFDLDRADDLLRSVHLRVGYERWEVGEIDHDPYAIHVHEVCQIRLSGSHAI